MMKTTRRAGFILWFYKKGNPLRKAVALASIGVFLSAQMAWAQQIVIDGQTQTRLDVNGNVTDVTTGTVRGSNAFNSFKVFDVYKGNIVNLQVPGQSSNLINLVHDKASQIDGILNGYQNGSIGGNIYFANPHGIMVGSGGVVNVGSLSLLTPTPEFMEGFFDSPGNPNDATTASLLTGSAPTNPNASISIEGQINALQGINLQGGTVAHSGELITGPAALQGKVDFSGLVNVGDLQPATGLVVENGEIRIVAAGDAAITGKVLAEGAHNLDGGVIDIRAGGDITVAGDALISAAGKGGNSSGGTIISWADNNARLADNALIDVSGGEISGDGGFAEFSARNRVDIAGGSFDASATNGVTGSVLIDPADIVVSADNFTNGGNYSLLADDSITINDGVIISTRKIGLLDDTLANHVTGASTGNSGSLSLTAPVITVGASYLLAHVEDGSTKTAGDINLTASSVSNNNVVGSIVDIQSNAAQINLNGSTLKGGNVNLSATAGNSRLFDDVAGSTEQNADTGGFMNDVLGFLDDFSLLGAVSLSDATATVAVNSGSSIDASGNLTISSDAKSDASATVKSMIVGFAYSESKAVASSIVDTGTTINADGNFNLTSSATSKSHTDTETFSYGANPTTLDITLVVSNAKGESNALINSGANVTVGDQLTVQADTFKDVKTVAKSGAYQDGQVGIAVGLSFADMDANAHVDGTVANAASGVKIAASVKTDSANDMENRTMADATAGNGLLQKLVVGGASGVRDKLMAKSGSASGGQKSNAGASNNGLAASWAYAEHDSDAVARIGDDAVVKSSAGTVDIDALVEDKIEISAKSFVNSTDETVKKNSLAAAVVTGNYTNSATASIGDRAVVDAGNDITVTSHTNLPQKPGYQIDSITDVTDYLNTNAGLQNAYANSWAQSAAQAADVGLAGSVNILNVDNTSEAYIGEGARVNQNLSTVGQDVTVEALNTLETVNVAGIFGVKLIASNASGGTGVGGSYLGSNFTNTTLARIEDGALVDANALTVKAESRNTHINVAEAGGLSKKFSINGTFTFADIDDRTIAQIDDGATIDADGNVNVTALDESTYFSASGGFSWGSGAGIGASVAWNDLTRDTQALIGNLPTDLVGAGSLTSAGDVAVTSTNSGQIDSWSLAAAVSTQNPPFTGVDKTAPKNTGTFGLAISGNVSLNDINDKTYATIESPLLTTNSVTVTATENSDIDAIGGAVAISRQSGGSTSALAGTWSQNTITNDTKATVKNSAVNAGGMLGITAATTGDILAVAASGAGVPQTGALNVAGSVTINTINSTTSAGIENSGIRGNGVNNLDEVLVDADNQARILSVSGSASFGGTAGVGAGVALNTIVGNTDAHIQGSDINSGGQVKVTADTGSTTTDNEIVTVSAAISGNGGSSALAAAAAVSINSITNTTSATITGKKTAQGVQAGTDIVVAANDDADIYTVAGNLAASGGTATFGGSYAENAIASTVSAKATDSAKLAASGKVTLDATTQAKISSIAAGGSGAGTLAIGGSVTLNTIANSIEARALNSDLDAAGLVSFTASDTSTIESLAGTVAGAGTFSVGAALATNTIGNTVTAAIDGSTVDSTANAISLSAAENSTIKSLSAGVSGAGTATLTGAVSLNKIGNTTDAHISNGAAATAAQDINLTASDTSTIRSLSGQAGGAGAAALGGAAAYNEITNITKAYADNSTLTSTGGSLGLAARSASTIETIAAGGSIGGYAGVAGSVAINMMANDTLAYVVTSVAKAENNVTLLADADNTIRTYGGSLGAGAVGAAGTVIVNTLENDTKAHVTGGTVWAKGIGAGATVKKWDAASGVESNEVVRGLSVVASASEDVDNRSMTVAGGIGGIGGNTSVTTVNDVTLGYIDNVQVNSAANMGQAVKVRAHQNTDVGSYGGAVSVGGVAVGGAVDTTLIGNTTKAYITDSSPASHAVMYANGGVEVNALTREKVASNVGGVSVGGYSVAGAVSVVETASTNEAYIREVNVNSNGNLEVLANNRTDVDIYAGLLAAGATLGGGGSVAVSNIANTTRAYMTGVVTNAKGTTKVDAQSVEDAVIGVGTAGIGGVAGVAGAVAVNSIGATTQAYLNSGTRISSLNQDVSYATATQDVTVSAKDTATINDDAGTLAGGSLGAGATVDVATIKNDVRAYVGDNTAISAGQNVLVKAESAKNVDSLAVAFAVGGVAGSGAVSVVAIGNGLDGAGAGEADNVATDVNSDISLTGGVTGVGSDSTANAAKTKTNKTLSITDDLSTASVTKETSAYLGNGTTVTAGGTIKIDADDNTRVDLVDGGAALGLAGVGGSVGIATLRNRTNAYTGNGVLSAVGNIEVTANGNVNDSDVEARTGAGGLVALGAGYAKIDSDNDVSAYLGTGARIDKAADLKVLAGSSSDVRAYANGQAVGGAAVGTVITNASETGTTQAYLGARVDVADDDLADATKSVNNLTIAANSTTLVTSTGNASSGGAAAATGVDTTATANPTTKAFIQNNVAATPSDIDLNGSLTLTADADSHAYSTATGTAWGGVAVGASLAKAYSAATVDASLGSYTTVQANGSATMTALFNRNIIGGAGVANAANASVTSSGGSLFAAGVGSDADVTSAMNVTANIGNNSVINTGGAIAIKADGYLDNTATSNGNAAGLVTAGGVESTATVTGNVGSTIGASASLTAATSFSQQALSQSLANLNSSGGSGQSLSDTVAGWFQGDFSSVPSFTSYGGAGTYVNMNNTSGSSVGSNATVMAGQALDMAARTNTDVYTYAGMYTSGAFAGSALSESTVNVDSDATVAVGSSAVLNGADVTLVADNDISSTSRASAEAFADAAGPFASAYAKNFVGSGTDKAQAKIQLDSGATITARQKATLTATTDSYNYRDGNATKNNIWTDAYSKAETEGIAAFALAETRSAVDVDSLVATVAGSVINAIDVAIKADTSVGIERTPNAQAQPVSILQEVWTTVWDKIVEWLPWPFDDIVSWVSRQVLTIVEVILVGIADQRATGAGLLSSETVQLYGDIHIGGNATRTLLVNADGSIAPSSTITPTISATDVIVPNVVNNSSGSVWINVPQGSLVGNGSIYVNNILEQVSIENRSNRNLQINDIDMINLSKTTPAILINSQGTSFDVQVKSDANPSSINIVNGGIGDVIFNTKIENYFADYSVSNTGGDLLAKDGSVFLEGHNFSLTANEGQIGTALTPLRLYSTPTATTAQLNAFAYGPITLDVSLFNPINLIVNPSASPPVNGVLSPTFEAQGLLLNDIKSFGDVSLRINNGLARTTQAVERFELAYEWTNPVTGAKIPIYERYVDVVTSNVDADGLVQINNITAGGNVVLNNPGNRTTLQVDGTVQSGYDNITVNIAADGTATSNLPEDYNFIASQDATTIVLKDLVSNGTSSGNITVNAKSLTGSGWLNAANGFTDVTVTNASNLNLQTNLIEAGTRGGGIVQGTINGVFDPSIADLEYPSVRVNRSGNADAGGSISVTASGTGTLQANQLIATAGGPLTLSSQGNLLLTATGDLLSAGSGDVVLTSTNATITMADGAVADAGSGNMTLSAAGNVALGELRSSSGAITVTAGSGASVVGAITDNTSAEGANIVTSGLVTMFAETGIGSTNDINTDAGSLQATNNVSGNLYIEENNGLVVAGGGIRTLAGNGIVGVDVNAGALTVNGVVTASGSGNVALNADDGLIDVNAVVSSTVGNIVITGDSITQDANVTTGGAGTIAVSTDNGGIAMADGTVTTSGSGVIGYTATGDVALSQLGSTSGAITVTAGSGSSVVGAITDSSATEGANIATTGQVTLAAETGIGSTDNINTTVASLQATNNISGNLYIEESDSLVVNGTGIRTLGGNGTIGVDVNAGALTVNSFVTAQGSGAVTLNADAGLVDVNAAVSSTTGNVSITADSVTQYANVTTGGAGTISLTADNGGIVMADGTVATSGSGMIGYSATGDVALSQLGSTSGALNVTSGSGAIVDNTALEGANLVSAGTATLSAATGIGSGDDLDTTIGLLQATNTTSGNISIEESDGLVVAGGGIRTLAGNGAVGVDVNAGALTVNGVVSANGSGNVALNTDAGLIDVNAAVSSTAGNIGITADSVTLDANVATGGGSVTVTADSGAIAMADGAVADAGSGDITLSATGNVALGELRNTNGAITVTAGSGASLVGAITDNTTAEGANIATNGVVILTAETGIGSDDDINTTVGLLQATNTTSGNISIEESDGLIVAGSGIRTLDGNGTVGVDVNAGTLTVGSVVSANGSGNVALNADAGPVDVNAVVSSTTGNVGIAADSITQDAHVTTGGAGTVTISADNGGIVMADGTSTSSGSGTIGYSATGDVALSQLSSSSGALSVTSGSGAINDNTASEGANLTTAGTATLSAATGIGSTDDIDTAIGSLQATNTTNGNVVIDEADNLNIVQVTQIAPVGFVTVTTGSDLTVVVAGGGISAVNGVVTLDVNNGGSLTVNDFVTTTGGAIDLLADGNASFGSAGDVTSATGNVAVTADADGDSSGAISMTDGAVINAGSGTVDLNAYGDITLGSVQTTNDTNAAVTITSTAGAVLDGGATDLEIVADSANAVVTLDAATGINSIETDIAHVDASVTGSGAISLNELDGIELRAVDTANGAITVVAGGQVVATDVNSSAIDNDANDITLTSTGAGIQVTNVNAGSANDVTLTAAGAVTQDGDVAADVVADALVVDAGTGVNLDTTVASVDLGNSTSGDVVVDESDSLNLTQIMQTAGNGAVSVTAAGDLTVVAAGGGISAVNGPVTLDVNGGGTLTVNDFVTTAGGAIDLLADGNASFGSAGDVTSATGNVAVTADADGNGSGALSMIDGAVINAGSGTVDLNAYGDITLGSVQTTNDTSAAVTITSTAGAVLDGGDTDREVVANSPNALVTIDAVTGVGSANALEATISRLDADNLISGNVLINEMDGLIINQITQSTPAGVVTVMTGSDLTVLAGGGGVSAVNGPVTLDVNGGGSLTVNDSMTTAGGAIALLADGDARFGSDGDVASATGNVVVTADADGTGSGALSMADGAVIDAGTGMIALQAYGDVTLGSVLTTNDTAGAVTVTSLAGGIVDGGDAHLEIDANSPNAVVFLTAATGIGAASGVGADPALEINVAHLDAHAAATGTLAVNEVDGIELRDVDTADGAITVVAGDRIVATDVDSSATDNDSNDIVLTSTGAGIEVASINAGIANDVVLTANNAILNRAAVGGINVVGGDLTLTSNGGDIGEEATFFRVDSNGTVNADAYGSIYLEEVNGDFVSDYLIGRTGNIGLRVTDGSATLGRISAAGSVSFDVNGPLLFIGTLSTYDLFLQLPLEGARLDMDAAEIGYRLRIFADNIDLPYVNHTGATDALHFSLAGNDGGMADTVNLYATGPGGIVFDELRSDFAFIHANVDNVSYAENRIGTWADLMNSRYRVVVDNRQHHTLHPAGVQLYAPFDNFMLRMFKDPFVETNAWIVNYDGEFIVNDFSTENSLTRLTPKRLYQDNYPAEPPRRNLFYIEQNDEDDWPYLEEYPADLIRVAPDLFQREARNLIGTSAELGLVN